MRKINGLRNPTKNNRIKRAGTFNSSSLDYSPFAD